MAAAKSFSATIIDRGKEQTVRLDFANFDELVKKYPDKSDEEAALAQWQEWNPNGKISNFKLIGDTPPEQIHRIAALVEPLNP